MTKWADDFSHSVPSSPPPLTQCFALFNAHQFLWGKKKYKANWNKTTHGLLTSHVSKKKWKKKKKMLWWKDGDPYGAKIFLRVLRKANVFLFVHNVNALCRKTNWTKQKTRESYLCRQQEVPKVWERTHIFFCIYFFRTTSSRVKVHKKCCFVVHWQK